MGLPELSSLDSGPARVILQQQPAGLCWRLRACRRTLRVFNPATGKGEDYSIPLPAMVMAAIPTQHGRTRLFCHALRDGDSTAGLMDDELFYAPMLGITIEGELRPHKACMPRWSDPRLIWKLERCLFGNQGFQALHPNLYLDDQGKPRARLRFIDYRLFCMAIARNGHFPVERLVPCGHSLGQFLDSMCP